MKSHPREAEGGRRRGDFQRRLPATVLFSASETLPPPPPGPVPVEFIAIGAATSARATLSTRLMSLCYAIAKVIRGAAS